MVTRTPQEYVEAAVSGAVLTAGMAERFAGYALMGMPFSSGHYLAFRHFPASSIGPGYRSVWLRRPDGQWTIYADAPPELSCARYFGSALIAARVAGVTESWKGPYTAAVTVPGVLEWRFELAQSSATRAVGAMVARMPERLWGSGPVLRGMGMMAGPVLDAGKLRFSGTVPNGQTFRAQPRRVWIVRSASATIDGAVAGRPGRLPQQEHLRDFWLPQRGLFVADLGVAFPSTAAAGNGAAQPAESNSETRTS
ncbi:hypothetical protein [Arthrobacter livingstonensis]|uniref:hypothetical protein n=1 Tax=Arthrobacter livingstonensis TaxID=670078 RepID=UPI001B885241|nr:hypothetical protein [Arthrobacter livingstonensis]